MRVRKITQRVVRQYVRYLRWMPEGMVEEYWRLAWNTNPRRHDHEGGQAAIHVLRQLAFREMMRRKRNGEPRDQLEARLLTESRKRSKL